MHKYLSFVSGHKISFQEKCDNPMTNVGGILNLRGLLILSFPKTL